MNIQHGYGHASGESHLNCHVIGYRYPEDEGFSYDRGESYIIELAGDLLCTRYKSRWLTGLWRSRQGNVYVTDAGRAIIHLSAGMDTPIHDKDIEFSPFGIWGLDDEHVYAWGRSGSESRLSFWNGRVWEEIAPPRSPITALHGVSSELLFAVVNDGSIVRWDGVTWKEMATPGDYALRSVFVVSEDEVYACASAGWLLQGSIHSWTELTYLREELATVVKWNEEVWVGSLGDSGLCRLAGLKLESIKPKMQTDRCEAGESLLISAGNLIASTQNGTDFRGRLVAAFAENVKDNTPLWVEQLED